jgi:long-chain acyl-CoA synthetase
VLDNGQVTNLARNLTDTTRAHAGRTAVRVDDAATTYQALDEASARVGGLLHERGLKTGDRVGIMMPNVAEVPVVYYGVLRAGGVVVPMNPLLKAREVAYYLGDSGARLMFAWHSFADPAKGGAAQAEAESIVVDAVSFPDLLASVAPDDQMADTGDEDTAVILYTSGTTGHPKGAELTHGNLISNTAVTCADIVQAHPDDVIFGGLPLFHVFGQTAALNVAVASGACLTLLPRFDAGHALRIIAGHRVTVFEGVPTMYVALLHAPDRCGLRHLRAADVRLRRRGPAGRGAARVRGGVRRPGTGGVRAVRNLAGRLVQPPRPRAKARLDRHADPGRADARRGQRRPRGPAG